MKSNKTPSLFFYETSTQIAFIDKAMKDKDFWQNFDNKRDLLLLLAMTKEIEYIRFYQNHENPNELFFECAKSDNIYFRPIDLSLTREEVFKENKKKYSFVFYDLIITAQTMTGYAQPKALCLKPFYKKTNLTQDYSQAADKLILNYELNISLEPHEHIKPIKI